MKFVGIKLKKTNSQYSKVTIGIDNEEYRAYDINVRYVYALVRKPEL